jgi:hypothetical protein
MEAKMDISDSIARTAQNVVRTKPWIERLARLGYAVKGLVYFLIGLLAIQAALGMGGETTDTGGALLAIYRQPFGQALLVLTAIGLFGYALWRLVQAWLDPDHNDSNSPKRIVQRIGYVVSAFVYGLLGWEAVRIVMGLARSDSGQDGTEHWTAQLMAQPFGRWLVGIVGLIIIGVGLFQIYYGVAAKFRNELKLHQMSATERTWAIRSGRLGYSARGLIYTIIGGFLIWAAIQTNPDSAVGMEEALDKVAQQPFGAWLLALVALGLMAYAVFAFVQARYRNIEVESN